MSLLSRGLGCTRQRAKEQFGELLSPSRPCRAPRDLWGHLYAIRRTGAACRFTAAAASCRRRRPCSLGQRPPAALQPLVQRPPAALQPVAQDLSSIASNSLSRLYSQALSTLACAAQLKSAIAPVQHCKHAPARHRNAAGSAAHGEPFAAPRSDPSVPAAAAAAAGCPLPLLWPPEAAAAGLALLAAPPFLPCATAALCPAPAAPCDAPAAAPPSLPPPSLPPAAAASAMALRTAAMRCWCSLLLRCRLWLSTVLAENPGTDMFLQRHTQQQRLSMALAAMRPPTWWRPPPTAPTRCS